VFYELCFSELLYCILNMLDARRNEMILTRSPGPYEDKRGPIVLGTIFIISVLSQVLIKVVET
jgi:hypothetical protein